MLNATQETAPANDLVVPVAADDEIHLCNNAGSIDLIADHAGYLTGR